MQNKSEKPATTALVCLARGRNAKGRFAVERNNIKYRLSGRILVGHKSVESGDGLLAAVN